MKQRLASKVLTIFVVAAFVGFAPIIPIQLVLKDNLPPIVAEAAIDSDDVDQIVTQARGGKFVTLIELLDGTVNAPYTHVSLIQPENVPYEGSVEDRSDVVVSYRKCAPGAIIAHCAGHRVYLRRTRNAWKVVEEADWIS